MPHTVFGIEEVAEYLHLHRDLIELMVRRREIPFEKMGDRIVFRRREVDAWASQRILGFDEKELKDYHARSTAKMHNLDEHHAIITELLQGERIQTKIASKTKPSVLRLLVDTADQTGLLIYPDDLLASLVEREHLCSTALSGGVAMVHPQHHDPYTFEDSFVVLGRSVQPIPFGAPDGCMTDLFFLICCQSDRIHLHVLARLCMLSHQTSLLLELREAASAADMQAAVERAEIQLIKSKL